MTKLSGENKMQNNKKVAELVTLVAMMHELNKLKGPLFLFKPMTKATKTGKGKTKTATSYTVRCHLKKNPLFDRIAKPKAANQQTHAQENVSMLYNGPIEDTSCIVYHPYIHLFCEIAYTEWYNVDLTVSATPEVKAANLAAMYEWLRTRMKYPPFAREVRAFELNAHNQLTESEHYLKGFFKAEQHFLWQSFAIIFDEVITSSEHLEKMLRRIATFRAKLISNLKNHQVINERQTRYLWKVVPEPTNNKLFLYVLLAKKLMVNDKVLPKDRHKELHFHTVKQVNNTIESLGIPAELYMPDGHTTWDGKKDKRKAFNQRLTYYFNQPHWLTYARIPCKEPRKMLFGKGQDKEATAERIEE